jgi:CheY-like chemotaxis protein
MSNSVNGVGSQVERHHNGSSSQTNRSSKEFASGQLGRHEHVEVIMTLENRPLSAEVRPLRFFLVEDSEVIRQNLIATLEEMLNMQVVGWAADETTAVDWMNQHVKAPACDLMIIDIFLRTGTGLEVLRRARQAMPQTRLVVLSNYATSEMRQRCAQLGADRVFDKSAELEELIVYCEDLTGTAAH